MILVLAIVALLTITNATSKTVPVQQESSIPSHSTRLGSNTGPLANSVSIVLNGFIGGWNNTNVPITVAQGETVTITFNSGDGAPHRFLLDMDKDSVSDTGDCNVTDPCSPQFPPNQQTLTFTAGTAGTYTYYCTIHTTSMVGTFTINSASATGGGGGHLWEK